jgi:phosphohistidine phosphatase
MMEVYLLRHGISEDDSPTGKDSDRRLTDEGRRKTREVMKVIAEAGLRPQAVVSSPYIRARQTAEVAMEVLGSKDALQFSDNLVPESDPQDIWRELRNGYSSFGSVLLVSHEPLMGRCTGFLLGVPELTVDFKKSGIIRIDLEPVGVHPRGVLKWMLVPKLTGA